MGKRPASGEEVAGLETLLSLNGEVFCWSGYWVKFEAWRVDPDEHVPHGIRYSLTLHDADNRRLVGYDNAHAVQGRKKRYEPKRVVWDHRHLYDRVEPYKFSDAVTLLEDFWADVESVVSGE